ncbi:hypothetical protein ACNS7O_02200 [Haloferacaceae archaeon DSL9]
MTSQSKPLAPPSTSVPTQSPATARNRSPDRPSTAAEAVRRCPVLFTSTATTPLPNLVDETNQAIW